MFWRYYNGYTDIWMFLDTFAYNFGLMYDSIVNAIVELFTAGSDPNYFLVGYSVGNLLYLVFFTE
jgi:hypothetical protein